MSSSPPPHTEVPRRRRNAVPDIEPLLVAMGFFDGDEEYHQSRRSRGTAISSRASSQQEAFVISPLMINVPANSVGEAGTDNPAVAGSAPGPGAASCGIEASGSWATVDEPYARRGSSSRHSRRRRGLGSVEIEDGILTMSSQTLSTRSSTTSWESGEEGGIGPLGIPGRFNATG